jgi:hypothetical protein
LFHRGQCINSLLGNEMSELLTKDLLLTSLQKISWSMTVNFRHGSSKIRHKMTSMTKFENIMYWASWIPSRDVLKFSS